MYCNRPHTSFVGHTNDYSRYYIQCGLGIRTYEEEVEQCRSNHKVCEDGCKFDAERNAAYSFGRGIDWASFNRCRNRCINIHNDCIGVVRRKYGLE